ncbi:MAG TPA: carotenoid oxygenase family protein [Polyangiaceae bacterium]|nr:carotenoid oxygenase family protein [Polyangiaceae bacterium]
MMNAEILPNPSLVAPAERSERAPIPAVSRALLAEGLVEREGVLTGTLPPWLNGRLLRTAPALFNAGTFHAKHWFDGIGMLYGFRFRGGKATFAQRLLECEAAAEAHRGRLPRATFASPNQRSFWRRIFEPIPEVTDNANVNVLRQGDEWVALTESPYQLRVSDAELSVRGRVVYDDALPKNMGMTAHPHFDFARNVAVNLGTVLGRKGELIAFEQAQGSATRREIGRYVANELPYQHSFGITAASVVIVGHPWLVRPTSLLWSNRGFAEHFRWKPELGTRFIVLDRGGGATREFSAEALFTFHTVNTYPDGDDLVLDLLAYPDPSIVQNLKVENMLDGIVGLRPRLCRAHLGANGRARLETLSELGFEFPSINYRRVSGVRHRFVWGATARGDGRDIVGIDCESGVVRHFGVPGFVFGEPIFVAAPGARAEDEGVLLAVGSNGESSKLAVLDAHSLEPEALLHLDLPIPLGFHGSFSRDGGDRVAA